MRAQKVNVELFSDTNNWFYFQHNYLILTNQKSKDIHVRWTFINGRGRCEWVLMFRGAVWRCLSYTYLLTFIPCLFCSLLTKTAGEEADLLSPPTQTLLPQLTSPRIHPRQSRRLQLQAGRPMIPLSSTMLTNPWMESFGVFEHVFPAVDYLDHFCFFSGTPSVDK